LERKDTKKSTPRLNKKPLLNENMILRITNNASCSFLLFTIFGSQNFFEPISPTKFLSLHIHNPPSFSASEFPLRLPCKGSPFYTVWKFTPYCLLKIAY